MLEMVRRFQQVVHDTAGREAFTNRNNGPTAELAVRYMLDLLNS
ncbi:hypothetical protein [Bradyrhizobium sp. Ec3.3]|nr:hypothetical protein [Bradyrhizobium sp. Ec3.3]